MDWHVLCWSGTSGNNRMMYLYSLTIVLTGTIVVKQSLLSFLPEQRMKQDVSDILDGGVYVPISGGKLQVSTFHYL